MMNEDALQSSPVHILFAHVLCLKIGDSNLIVVHLLTFSCSATDARRRRQH